MLYSPGVRRRFFRRLGRICSIVLLFCLTLLASFLLVPGIPMTLTVSGELIEPPREIFQVSWRPRDGAYREQESRRFHIAQGAYHVSVRLLEMPDLVRLDPIAGAGQVHLARVCAHMVFPIYCVTSGAALQQMVQRMSHIDSIHSSDDGLSLTTRQYDPQLEMVLPKEVSQPLTILFLVLTLGFSVGMTVAVVKLLPKVPTLGQQLCRYGKSVGAATLGLLARLPALGRQFLSQHAALVSYGLLCGVTLVLSWLLLGDLIPLRLTVSGALIEPPRELFQVSWRPQDGAYREQESRRFHIAQGAYHLSVPLREVPDLVRLDPIAGAGQVRLERVCVQVVVPLYCLESGEALQQRILRTHHVDDTHSSEQGLTLTTRRYDPQLEMAFSPEVSQRLGTLRLILALGLGLIVTVSVVKLWPRVAPPVWVLRTPQQSEAASPDIRS